VQSDRIKEERYDSWHRARSFAWPNPTRSKIFYGVRRLFMHETKARARDSRIAKEKGGPEAQLPTVALMWKRNSCPKRHIYFALLCSTLLCSLLFCFALPCPNWPLSIVLHSDVAFNRAIVKRFAKAGHTWMQKLKSGQKKSEEMHHSTDSDIHWC